MNKIERLTNTILLLQERGRTSQELSELLEVSRRTVIRDVEALCEMGVPIIAQGGIGGGYSLAGEYSIAPLQLTWREAMLLILALSSLSKMSDTPFSAERASLFVKVSNLIPARHKEQVQSYLDKVEMEIPERRKAPLLDQLIEAAKRSAWQELKYDAPEGQTAIPMRIDRVFADRGFWYVSGHSEGKSLRLRTDRILKATSIEPMAANEPLPYGHPSHPKVVVKLSQRGFRNVERDPHLGPALKGHKGDTIEFHCPPEELDWYAKYFGSMGNDAVIGGPPELLEKIRAWAEKILEIYKTG